MPTATMIQARAPREDYTPQYFLRALPFIGFHVAAIVGAFYVHPTVGDLLLCASLYYLRMFGDHRRLPPLLLAPHLRDLPRLPVPAGLARDAPPSRRARCGGPPTTATTTAPRTRPRTSTRRRSRGSGGRTSAGSCRRKYDATDFDAIRDFAMFPELRFLNKYFLIPPVLLAVGPVPGRRHPRPGLGLRGRTVLLWHGTFTINSLTHVFGRVRFPTTDTSRNNLSLALLTMGEGWHNNHHYYPGSMRQGFYWWEIDLAGYVIRALSWFGIVWDIRTAPERVLNLGLGKGDPAEAQAESIAEAA